MEILILVLNYGLAFMYGYMGATGDDKVRKRWDYTVAALWLAVGILNSIAFCY